MDIHEQVRISVAAAAAAGGIDAYHQVGLLGITSMSYTVHFPTAYCWYVNNSHSVSCI